MTIEETIAQAKQEVDKLKALLDDPHPGLFTWMEAIDKQAQKVAGIFGFQDAKESSNV